MTTEERLADLKDLLEHVTTRGEFEYVQEQIEELELMIHYESIIREKESN